MAKLYFKLLISFILVGSVLFYFNFMASKSPQLDFLIGKSVSFTHVLGKNNGLVSNKVPLFSTCEKFTLREKSEKMGYDNIVWRTKIWSQTIRFALNSCWLGKGFGNYPVYDIWGYRKPYSAFTDSNIIPVYNYLITIFYKLGFFGLFLFLFNIFYVFYYALSYLKTCKREFIKCILTGALGALLFWQGTALFFDVIDSPPTSILLWIITGLIFAVIEVDKNVTKVKGAKLDVLK
jgi:hypothetical protein